MNRAEIRAAYNLLKVRLLKKRIPLVVGWSVTNRCNSKCFYCSRWANGSDELSTEQICSVIDQMVDLGTYTINFTGGEPLLRNDIGSILNYAKKKGIRVGLSSNGILVPDKIKDIKTIDFLVLSYDGPKEIHDRLRGQGDHQRVIYAIRIAKENNIYVKLHTVLTRDNIDYIDFILKFARDHGVIVSFSIIENNPFSKKENITSLLPPIEKYRLAINTIIFRKINGEKVIGNTLKGLKYLSLWPSYRQIPCCAGKIYCRIEPNGDIYPCGQLVLRETPQNCLLEGAKKAFLNLRFNQCKSCWCDTRIDMNYVYSFNLRTIAEKIRECNYNQQ